MTIGILPREEARTQWRWLLDLAGSENTDVLIERHGKPTAAVIGYASYQKVQSRVKY